MASLRVLDTASSSAALWKNVSTMGLVKGSLEMMDAAPRTETFVSAIIFVSCSSSLFCGRDANGSDELGWG